MTTEPTRPPDERAGALDDLRRCFDRRAPGHGSDGGTRRLGLEAAVGAAGTQPSLWHNDHMTDVSGVPGRTVEQPTVQHDAAADAGRHDHGDEVACSLRRADPSLSQRQCFRVVVDVNVESGVGGEPRAQGKRPPRRDVQRRDQLATGRHRTPAADAHDLGVSTIPTRQRVDHSGQRRPQHLPVRSHRRGRLDPARDRAVFVHEARCDLGAADVDREGGPHGRTT